MAHISSLPFNDFNDDFEKNDILKNAVNSIEHAVCIIDEKSYVRYVNNYFTKLLNISEFEIVNRKFFKVISNEIISSSIKSKMNKTGIIKGNNGKTFRVSTNVIYNNNDNYNGVVVIYSNSNTIESKISKLKRDTSVKNPYPVIISNNNRFILELKKAYKASKTNATILITGESGTGKEIIANEIHKSSKRKGERFVAVNCGAIPEKLIESYLFGYKKGSFTGAKSDKVGKFEYANGGTLFLDDIGELPLRMQVKLLRVIEERKISPIGSNDLIDIDVRIIAATNSNLINMIKNKTFREDLYYRLNVIPLDLIPLRCRIDDISLLIKYFKNKYIKANEVSDIEISDEAMNALCEYEWPGNIRELKNVVERLIVLSEDDYIDFFDLPSSITNYYGEMKSKKVDYLINYNVGNDIESFDVYEKEIYRIAYEKYGSFNKAAKVLGVTHKTVASKLRKYELI